VAQVFDCQAPGTRFPFRVRRINTPKTGLVVVSAVTYPAIGCIFTPGATGKGKTIYDNAQTFDTTLFSWLVMAQTGVNYPVLIKELDFVNATTLLGDWVLLARIADGQCYRVPQV
jgi:hypothetical protein